MRTAKSSLVAFMTQNIDNCPVLTMQEEGNTGCSESSGEILGREGHLCEGSFIQVILQGLKVTRVHRAMMLGVQCEMRPQNAAPFGQRLLPSDV